VLLDVVLMALLCVFSAVEALAGVFYLPLWWHGNPFPITALICGAANVVVMALAMGVSRRFGVAPLITWLLVCVAALFPGPGGDRLLLFAGDDWRALLLLACGAVPAVLVRRVSSRRSSPGAGRSS
jgi:hypothetical protein